MQPTGGAIGGMKSVVLLGMMGSLLVSGCRSPLHDAVQNNDANTVNELLNQGADVNEKHFSRTALLVASSQGRVEMVTLLLDRGADVNLVSPQHGTALTVASYKGHVEVAKLLLDRGAEVDLIPSGGWTALSYAAYWGNTDVAVLLMARGADINKAIVGLRRGFGTGNAVEFLNGLKYKKTTPPRGPDSPAVPPTTLPPPAESAAPF